MVTTPEIICFGEPMVEFNAVTTGRLKDIRTFERGYGGDTSNMAVAIARLNHTSGYITKLGDDEFGTCLLDLWKREDVDTSRVLTHPEAFTAIYFVSRTEARDHEFTYFRRGSAASHFHTSDLDLDYIRSAKAFHTSGITQAISPSCRKAVATVAAEVQGEDTLFTYDPNIRLKLWSLDTARTTVLQTMRLADVVMPSIDDARLLFPEQSAREILTAILELGPRVVTIKLGPRGCLVGNVDTIHEVPSLPVDFVDSTGAGDAFDGAFVTALLEGMALEDAALYANAVGALKCRGKGAITPLPTREAVNRFLREHAKTR
jgi:2-dehydro-3-deoxygluconokinase